MRALAGDLTRVSQTAHGVTLSIGGGHTLHLSALEEDMIRVRLDRDGGRAVPSSWMVAPGGDAPYEGRDKEDLSGFTLPHVIVDEVDGALRVSTSRLRVLVPLGVAAALALQWCATAKSNPIPPWSRVGHSELTETPRSHSPAPQGVERFGGRRVEAAHG